MLNPCRLVRERTNERTNDESDLMNEWVKNERMNKDMQESPT